MRIKYLGTGGAEGIPGMFCNCELCNFAREHRGKELRTRSQAIIDGKLLVDFPADTYLHVLHTGLDLREIHTCIITHSHYDHLDEKSFWCRTKFIANNIGEESMRVYATEDGYDKLVREKQKEYPEDTRVMPMLVTPFLPFESEGYRIIPLKANHDPDSDPVFYIIEKDEKTLLYAQDTGYFPEESWDYLKGYKRSFDFINFDCTCALKDIRDSHMGLITNGKVRDRLAEMGLCRPDTVIYTTHFSHNRAAPHATLEAEAGKYGFKVAFDGCEVEF